MELYFTDHSDNSTLICYTVSSFECKYFNTKEKNIQDFSQQWAEYLHTHFSRKHIDGQEAHEKRLNITNY